MSSSHIDAIALPCTHYHHHSTVVMEHQQGGPRLSELPGQDFQKLERVERRVSWETISSCSTASNIRGPGRTLGNLISNAGRRLEQALAIIPETQSPSPEVILHQRAEESLKEAKMRLSNQSRVLLLGSETSGKYGILKQMRFQNAILHSPAELESFRQQVYEQVVHGMLVILDAVDANGLDVSVDNKRKVELICRRTGDSDLCDSESFSSDLCDALASLWSDVSIQIIWESRNSLALSESVLYFLSSLDRIFHPAYVPTDQDVQHLDTPTGSRGVVETTFQFGKSEIVIIDPGRGMGVQRKWIHQFSNMTNILFVVNLCCYDECVIEDRNANQMREAITHWAAICHSQWFEQTSLILFLNKYELFKQKIKTSDIKNCFPDFKGPTGDANAGVAYFRKRFIRLAMKSRRKPEQEIYIYTLNPSDGQLLRLLKTVVQDTISQRHLNTPKAESLL